MLWDSQQVHLSGHCTLSSLAGFSSLNTWRLQQYYFLICKVILSMLPLYRCAKFTAVQITDNLRANSLLWFKVPLMRSELGKETLSYWGSRNYLQVRFWMGSFIPFQVLNILSPDYHLPAAAVIPSVSVVWRVWCLSSHFIVFFPHQLTCLTVFILCRFACFCTAALPDRHPCKKKKRSLNLKVKKKYIKKSNSNVSL